MGIQGRITGLSCAYWEMVDTARRAWFCIPHRYIRIAHTLDMKIKSAKAQFVGVQHA